MQGTTVHRVSGNVIDDPRLAAIYDALDPDRSDLDAYAAIAEELGARIVLDVGCGTGTFAVLLADRGLDVTALDPSHALLAVARQKPGLSACAGCPAMRPLCRGCKSTSQR